MLAKLSTWHNLKIAHEIVTGKLLDLTTHYGNECFGRFLVEQKQGQQEGKHFLTIYIRVGMRELSNLSLTKHKIRPDYENTTPSALDSK